MPSTNALVDFQSVDGPVFALLVTNGIAYVAGEFTRVNGENRNRIAAVDATTGRLLNWNAGASGAVKALAISGNTLYAGGEFDSIGGQPRSLVAALDLESGKANAWAPKLVGPPPTGFAPAPSVNAILVMEDQIVVGGVFTEVNEHAQTNLAALGLNGELVTAPRTPSNPGPVYALPATIVRVPSTSARAKFYRSKSEASP